MGVGEDPLWITIVIVGGGDGHATQGEDYALSGSTTFQFHPGDQVKYIDVDPINDRKVEGDEFVVATLDSIPSRVTVGTTQATLTIYDNDYWSWDEIEGADLDYSTPEDRPLTEGPVEMWANVYTLSAPSYVVASASGRAKVDRTWFPWGWTYDLYSVNSSIDVSATLADDGTITATYGSGTFDELGTHSHLSAAVGVTVTVNNDSETRRTVDVLFDMVVGYDYEYTTMTDVNASGTIGTPGASSTVHIGYTTQTTGSNNIKLPRQVKYTMIATAKEHHDYSVSGDGAVE